MCKPLRVTYFNGSSHDDDLFVGLCRVRKKRDMAFAAVISLKRTIKHLKTHMNPHIRKSAKEELNSLGYMLKRLDDQTRRMIDRIVINELDAKIRDAVWKLEDVLESYYSLNIPPSQGGGEKSCSRIPLIDEIEIKMEMDLFLKTVEMLKKEYYRVLIQNPLPAEAGALYEEEDEAAAVPPVNKSTTVGFSDLSQNIINQLLRGDDGLKIVSLFGMAGIGKTHLATDIYHHALTVHHFNLRAWVSVGPKYHEKNILVNIVSQIEGKPRDLFKKKDEFKLRDLLRNSLRSRRYLIVLDDIWSKEVWEYFMMLFLGYENGSRVLLTTRLQDAISSRYYHNLCLINEMPFLNNEESWNLLWQNVFVAEKSFPFQLEEPGKKIAENCEGLPLLILTVANILRGLNKTEEYWKKVAEKKTTTFTEAYDQIYEVLLPSYEYLPQHLKPCFLYMGVFPQSCEIPLSKLINFWVVEDILESSPFQQLEKIGTISMEDLVSKSLAIVCKRRFGGYTWIKSSKLHSVYCYLCVKEARKSKFLHVLNKLRDISEDYIENQRRLSVQNNILLGIKEVYDSMAIATSTSRSLLCTGKYHKYPVQICLNVMLLMRVLDTLAIRFYEFPEEVLKLLKLRYLSLTHNGELPSSISKLQQLECLILRRHHNIKLLHRDSSCLPGEIWDLKELRNLRIMGSNLPDPCKGANLPKLVTLYVNVDSCTEAVFRSIPNLEKLGITIELQPEDAAESVKCWEHIGVLDRLESVKCVVVNPRLRSQVVAPPNLLRYVQKLSLNGLEYPCEYVNAFCLLKNLKVLKLRCSAFQGADWKTEAGQFKNLEFLLLEDIDLVHWTAPHYLFYEILPSLSHLVVRHCYKLKMIPLEIGEISTMKMLEVDDCSPSVVDSAQKIMDRTTSSDLQLVINSSWN